MKKTIALSAFLFVTPFLLADEMVHKFKSPSFSGVGTSSHYLTIENQETNRRQAIKDEIAALAEKLEREKNNTVEARWMRNPYLRLYRPASRRCSVW